MNTTVKVALITGAGSGIGRAVATTLMANGYIAVLAGRRADALNETLAMGIEQGGAGLAVPTDISDPDSVSVLFERVQEAYGRLDVLFNNAGAQAPAVSLENLDTKSWQESIDVNISGAFYCTRAAFQIMKDQQPQGGRIINNGSISAHNPRPFSVAYTTTKHAMTGLTKAASLDGRAYNIACGQIDIGNALTDMTKNTSAGRLQPDGQTRPEAVMDVAHVATSVLHMAQLPLDANVQFMTVMATKMPFIGRG